MNDPKNPSQDEWKLTNHILTEMKKDINSIDTEVQNFKHLFQEFRNEINVRVVRLEERALIFATAGGALMGIASNLVFHFLTK